MWLYIHTLILCNSLVKKDCEVFIIQKYEYALFMVKYVLRHDATGHSCFYLQWWIVFSFHGRPTKFCIIYGCLTATTIVTARATSSSIIQQLLGSNGERRELISTFPKLQGAIGICGDIVTSSIIYVWHMYRKMHNCMNPYERIYRLMLDLIPKGLLIFIQKQMI